MWLEANESTQILLLFVTLKQAISAGWGGGGGGQPCGSRCWHGKREALGASPGPSTRFPPL